MMTPQTFGLLNTQRLSNCADWLVIGVALSLPWSTSATSIFIGLWLIALIPTLDGAALRQEIKTAAGGLPVLLFVVGILGMAWSIAPMPERLAGAAKFIRLLAIPLLLLQFQNSPRGRHVLLAFLASCSLLLAVSFVITLWPNLMPKRPLGVPVKAYIIQSAEFTLCAFALLFLAGEAWKSGARRRSLLLALPAIAFLFSIFFVATSRTTIVILPAILLIWAARQFGIKGGAIAVLVGLVTAWAVWSTSPYMRGRFAELLTTERQVQRMTIGTDVTETIATSTGERLEFWRKSLRFISEAPTFGHGTGSIRQNFANSVDDTSAAAAEISENPHNQTFAIAIQLGLVGAAILWAMWAAHLWLFRGDGLWNWLGFLVVIEHIGGSIFNSWLFDFTEGWLYVFGVGVIGGMVRLKFKGAA
jgi:O-antigen ligase